MLPNFHDVELVYGELDEMLKRVLGGRYYIADKLGGGGFGETYLARDRGLPTHPYCVVKQLKPHSTKPFHLQTARRLFATEAMVLHKLGKHDQIPQLMAYIEENDDFYLVEELIEGKNLALEITPGKKLSESYVIALLQDILNVLEFIQQHNVIHRDLKPSNLIRRQSDNKIVLIDFGAVKEIASIKALSDDLDENKSFTVAIGTPGYMPCEQSFGQPNFSSDIYAAGIIAIQALTGIQPHLISRDSNDEFVWRQEAKVSRKLINILNKMVRYHSNQRYQLATEVLQDLEKLTNLARVLSLKEQTSKERKPIHLLEMEEKIDSKQSKNSRAKKQQINLLEMEEKIDSSQSDNRREKKQQINLLEMEEKFESKQAENKQVKKNLHPVVSQDLAKIMNLN